MASPPKEKGFTKVPNDILEKLMTIRVNATQLRIILAVIRFTYGFNRIEHRLSDSYLAKAVGVSRTNLNRDIQPLFKSNVLIAVRRSRTDKNGSVLKLNQNLDTWMDSNPLTAVDLEDLNAFEIDTSTAIISDSTTAISLDSSSSIIDETQERKKLNKELNKKEKESFSPNKNVPANKSSKADKTSYGTYGWVLLSTEEYKGLLSDYSAQVVEHYIAIVDSRAQANNNKYCWADFNLKIRQAIKENWGGTPSKQSSIDKNYDIEF